MIPLFPLPVARIRIVLPFDSRGGNPPPFPLSFAGIFRCPLPVLISPNVPILPSAAYSHLSPSPPPNHVDKAGCLSQNQPLPFLVPREPFLFGQLHPSTATARTENRPPLESFPAVYVFRIASRVPTDPSGPSSPSSVAKTAGSATFVFSQSFEQAHGPPQGIPSPFSHNFPFWTASSINCLPSP